MMQNRAALGLPPVVHGPLTTLLGVVPLKAEESAYYERVYLLADPARTGQVSGLSVRALFSHTTLAKPQLAKIWEVSDRQKRKFLDREDFYIALRLIAIAQSNLPINIQSIKQYNNVQLPYFDHLPADASMTAPIVPTTAPISSPSPSLASPSIAAPVAGASLSVGAVSPAAAPPSSHPLFAPLPELTPQSKHHAKKPSAAININAVSPTPAAIPPVAPSSIHTPSPMPISVAPPVLVTSPSPPPSLGVDWSMSEDENIHYSSLFSQADADQDGYVSGKEATTFFRQSGLDNATLRKIWLLSDQDKDTKLNPEEFAIAMHLVMKARQKWQLPAVLPDVLANRFKKHHEQTFGSSAVGGFESVQPGTANGDFGFGPSEGFVNHSMPLSDNSSASLANTRSRVPSLSKLLGDLPIVTDSPSVSFGGNDSTPRTNVSAPSNPSSLMTQPVALFADPISSGLIASFPASSGSSTVNQVRHESLLRSAIDQTNADLAKSEQEKIDAQKMAEEPVSKVHQLEEQLAKLRAQVHSNQEEIRSSTAAMAEAQRRMPELKIESRELEAQIALHETQLNTLRSQLKDGERLKSGLETIVAMRKETLAKLIAEKNEVADLLSASKIDYQRLKQEDALYKEAIDSTIESTSMLREQAKEAKMVAEANKKLPAKIPAIVPTITETRIESVAAAVPVMKVSESKTNEVKTSAATAAASNIFDDDDAFKTDDLPDFDSHANTSTTFPPPAVFSTPAPLATTSPVHEGDNLFGATVSENKTVEVTKPSEPTKQETASSSSDDFSSPDWGSDPFGAPSDTFAAPPSTSAAAADDPFGSTSFDDPFGSSADDPFANETKAANPAASPLASPAAAPAATPAAFDFFPTDSSKPKPPPPPPIPPIPSPTLHAPSLPSPVAVQAASLSVPAVKPSASPSSHGGVNSFDEMMGGGIDDDAAPDSSEVTIHKIVAAPQSSNSEPAAASAAPSVPISDNPFEDTPDFPDWAPSANTTATASSSSAAVAAAPTTTASSDDWATFDTSW